MIELSFKQTPHTPLKVLCLGAHSDDIEIGCGGTILRLTQRDETAAFRWVVFSADHEQRRNEALAGAGAFLERATEKQVVVESFRESFFPYAGERLKERFQEIRSAFDPDLVFTHYRHDFHQDHKTISDLTWQTFRRSVILEYEIPKWDGDLGAPNCFAPISDDLVERKIRLLCETFKTQSAKPWFTADAFRALMRLRGVESNTGFAEAFYARKLVFG